MTITSAEKCWHTSGKITGRLTCGLCLVLLMCSGIRATASKDTHNLASDKDVSTRVSNFVWYGAGPDGKTDLMVAASRWGEFEPAILTVFKLATLGSCRTLVKKHEVSGPSAFNLSKLRVYRDPKRPILYAVVTQFGADTAGDWVVAIGTTGKPKTLWRQMGWGGPVFRLHNGTPEVREVWHADRLMETGWRPTREFSGHVLIERLYRLGPKQSFELKAVRPAVTEENKLSKKEFQYLIQARQGFESSHPASRPSAQKPKLRSRAE